MIDDVAYLILLPRKYKTMDGQRVFWNAKFFSVIVDASPETMKESDRVLRSDDGIIRFQAIKIETAADRFGSKNFRNPYAPRAPKHELEDGF